MKIKKAKRTRYQFLIYLMITMLFFTFVPIRTNAEMAPPFIQPTSSQSHIVTDHLPSPQPMPNSTTKVSYPVELTSDREENVKVFDNGNGTFTKKIYTEPVHLKENGKWKNISQNLSESSSNVIEPKKTKLKTKFQKVLNNGSYVQFESNGHTLSTTLLGANGDIGALKPTQSKAIYTDNTLWYRDIFPHIDLRSVTFNDNVKEDIVLQQYNGVSSFSFKIQTDLQPLSNLDGSIDFQDENQKTIFTLPKPYMSDSNVNQESGETATSQNVTYFITKQDNSTYVLTVTADSNWLQAPERVYPVYIDPSVTLKNVKDGYVSSAYPGTNYSGSSLWSSTQGAYVLNVGYYDSTTGDNYAYLKQDLSSLKGATISSAKLWLYCNWSYYSTTPTSTWISEAKWNWDPAAITWNNSPSVTDIGTSQTVRNSWTSFDVTSSIQKWNSNPSTNYGFSLHGSGTNQTYWKKFIAAENGTNVPYLEVTYSYPKPTQPTFTAYSNGSGSSSGYLNVSWNAVSGATGYDVLIFNGYKYVSFPAGNVTSWSTKGQGIWPTSAEIDAGKYDLHTDKKGAELALDPSPVYYNAYLDSSPYGDYSYAHRYWVRIVAHYPYGDSPTSDEVTPYIPLEQVKPPVGAAYTNITGNSGYTTVSWDPVPGATGYKVWVYNGKDYESFDAGNVTTWTTQNKNIWPTDSEIAAGRYLLHHEVPATGTELSLDPSPVYRNSGGSYGTSTNYWFRITAYSSTGYPDSSISDPFTPKFSITSLLGTKDYWASIPVIGGQVTAFNGNFVMSETDFQLLGRGPDVNIDRTYNSQDTGVGLFGTGWYSSLENNVKEDTTGNIILTEEDKGNILFTKTGTNQYQAPNGVYLEVTKTSSGYQIKDTDQSITFYSLDGKKQYEKDRYGNQVTYNYSNGSLISITDPSGRSFSFEYIGNHVSKITGPENRTVTFQYDGDNLVSSTTPNGKTYRYGYENGLLRYTYDPKNTDNTPYKTTYTYENNKLVKITDPLGKDTSLSYDDNSHQVTVTDPKGTKEIYNYTISGNPSQTVKDAEGLKITTTYQYEANDLKKKTDPNDQGKGTTETYTYDGNGNVTAVQDYLGTENYQYNQNNDVTKITTPDQKNTTITYDSVNPVSETDSDAKTSSVTTFDNYGNPVLGSAALTAGTNMFRNPGFEDDLSDGYGVSWGTGKNNNDAGSIIRDNTVLAPGFGGANSLRLESIPSGTGKSSVFAYQEINVHPKTTYTISAWVRTQNVTNAGVFINLAQIDGNGQWITGAWKDNRYSQVTGTKNWTEEQLTFTTTDTTSKIHVYLQMEQQTGGTTVGGGIAWIDKVQAEEGDVSSSFNPIVNGSFENNAPTYIQYWQQGSSDGSNPNQISPEAFDGSSSIGIERKNVTDANISYGQHVLLNQDPKQPPQMLTLTGMSKAENVKNADGLSQSKDYAIVASIGYQDGTSGQEAAMFSLGTHDWSRASVLINESKPIKYIDVYVIFNGKDTGKAWFDAIRLIEGNVLTKNEYDSNGNYLSASYDEANYRTSFTYDSYGNKKTEKDPMGYTKSYDYNLDNQLVNTTLPNGTTVGYKYDFNGNTTEKNISANGKTQTVTYAYDVDNKLTQYQDALMRNITNTYDANANLIGTQMPNGNLLEWTYDAANRMTQAKRNGTVAFTFGYDANGNETQVTDNVNGTTRVKAYDNGNRISSMTDRGGSISWTYDKASDKLTGTNITRGAYNNSTSYVYNKLDQNTQVVDGGQTYYFDYDEFGNVRTYTSGNGAGSSYHYDATNKVDQLTIGNKQGTILLDESYAYDPNGNRITINRKTDTGDQKISYEYDSINQLTKETLADGTIKEYSYDGFGNRTSVKVTSSGNSTTTNETFNDGNQLTAFGSESISYDADGNRTSDGKYSYKWNEADQLIAVSKIGESIPFATYKYDDDGRRIEKTVNGQTTRYYYDGDSINVLYETDASGNVLRQYVYGANGTRLAMKSQGQILYYHYNPHGDVIAMTDQNGNVVAKYDYDAWGNVLPSTSTQGLATDNPFQYAGYMYDKEIGMYYLVARFYNPVQGVFLSLDPEPGNDDEPVAQNGYNYANNNPINIIDPSGCSGSKTKEGLENGEGPSGGGGFAIGTAIISVVKAAGKKIVTGVKKLFGKGKGLQFSNKQSVEQWVKQYTKRGWNEKSIQNTIKSPYTKREGFNKYSGNTTTVYYNKDGSHIIVDNGTKKIIQISDRTKPWKPDSSIKNPYNP